MKPVNNKFFTACCFAWLSINVSSNTYAMGLRSFVALPVEANGAVARFALIHANDADIDTLVTSAAYGISSNQTLLFGLPYRLSPAGDDRQGDLSVLYRHIVWQQDSFSGTNRLGLLGGAIAPTESDRNAALQAGFVYTHFKNKNEIDFDVLYQSGLDTRPNSGRYDISWQYRLSPAERPSWGFSREINSVLEINGRWSEGSNTTHQLTVGAQWIDKSWVFESGIAKDINNTKELRYIISTRFHF